MTELLGRLIAILDVIGLEAFVPEAREEPAGRPRIDAAWRAPSSPRPCSALPPPALSSIALAPTNRCACGWKRRAQVPSEATFSRAFREFAQGDLPDKMHAALIGRALGGRIIGAIARDATEIEAREKPVEKDKKEGPPPPSASVPPQNKHGRPRKGQERSSERPKPEPTRLASRNDVQLTLRRRGKTGGPSNGTAAALWRHAR